MDQRKLYYYRMTGEPRYSGLALECQMHQSKGEDWRQLWYHDTMRGHMIKGELLRESENGFVFRSDGYEPGEWIFTVVTIEEFRQWIYQYVGMGEAIAAEIHTTGDLHEWYRREFGTTSVG